MIRNRAAIVLVIVTCGAILAACGGSSGGPPSASPSPSGPALSLVELKLRVLDALPGRVDWCDPDIYPVGIGTELQRARKALPRMQQDRGVYDAILDHVGISRDAELTTRQLVRVYGDYKLVAHETPVGLTRDGDVYRFDLVVSPPNAGYDDRVLGHVTADGAVTIDRRIRGNGSNHYFAPVCPICLARDTLIGAPGGSLRVQDVRVGMTVWSTDRARHRMRAAVGRVGRTAVPPSHVVIRLALADGRTVLVSPGHPTPDGTPVGDLTVGQRFEGTRVVSAERILYAGGFTYDLLPSGPTGTYFANGVLLASTLDRPVARSA
jgi:hypothetical protein